MEEQRDKEFMYKEYPCIIFEIGHVLYAVSSYEVRTMFEYKESTRDEGAPPYVRGMIKINDKSIALVDMRSLFKIGPEDLEHEMVMILDFEEPIGIIVDKIETVDFLYQFSESLKKVTENKYIKKVATDDKYGGVVYLLDTEILIRL